MSNDELLDGVAPIKARIMALLAMRIAFFVSALSTETLSRLDAIYIYKETKLEQQANRLEYRREG
jgi:hypothetical protein